MNEQNFEKQLKEKTQEIEALLKKYLPLCQDCDGSDELQYVGRWKADPPLVDAGDFPDVRRQWKGD